MTTRKISTDAEISAIRMNDQGSAPATPASGYSKIYTQSDGLYWIDDAGTSTGPLVDASGAIAFDGEVIGSDNLIKNYPSIEVADAAQPEWWDEEDANITLTEEDATGESCTGINERVLKIVTGASGANKYVYQRLTYADEPLLFASTTKISAGCWVYSTDTTGITLTLYDSAGGSLGTDSTSTQSAWTWLEITNVTLGAGTYVDFRVTEAGNSHTVYVANPTLNVGTLVVPFAPRRLKYVDAGASNVVNNVSPGGTGWTDVDFTANSSNLAAFLNITFEAHQNTNATGRAYVRRNGSSASGMETLVWRYGTPAGYGATNTIVPCDDGQIIEYSVSSTDVDNVYISLRGYWEWA